MTAVSAHDLLRTRTCAYRTCGRDAVHESGLCDEHEREERRKFGERPDDQKNGGTTVKTCSRGGCSNPPVYDRRGPYVGLCEEHKAEAKAAQPSPEPSVPPPATDPDPDTEQGHEPPPIAPEPAPAQASEGTSGGTLVEHAQRVSDLTERRRGMLADLDRVEVELRQALAACEDALRACAVEGVAA